MIYRQSTVIPWSGQEVVLVMATSVCDITQLHICSASSCPFRWFEAHAHDLNAFLLFSLVISLSRLLVCLCCSLLAGFTSDSRSLQQLTQIPGELN